MRQNRECASKQVLHTAQMRALIRESILWGDHFITISNQQKDLTPFVPLIAFIKTETKEIINDTQKIILKKKKVKNN